jgi:DNA mismatch repair protein MutS
MTKADQKMTPMLRQYMEIKSRYEDAILFYRMGDFYEMFFEDAKTASKVLGITLTSRNNKSDRDKVPMCGVPFHAVSSYLPKMVKAGYRVAICEQVEDPKDVKAGKIVKRDVIRVVTPGVTTEEHLLDDKSNRYLAAICPMKSGRGQEEIFGLSLLDITTGEFLLAELNNRDELVDEMTRMAPAELLLAEGGESESLAGLFRSLLTDLCVTERPSHTFQPETAKETLLDHFKTVNLAGFGCEHLAAGVTAAGALLQYVSETQKSDISHIEKITPIDREGFLQIDEASRRNLELVQTIVGAQRQGSLLAVLDYTSTPMGARLLKKRMLFPLQSVAKITARLGGVEAFYLDTELREHMRRRLAAIYDLERLNSRVVLGSANGRDLLAISRSLAELPVLKQLAATVDSDLVRRIGEEIDELAEIQQLIEAAINEEAPITLREGNLIKEGYNSELDDLVAILRDGKSLIASLEASERQKTGISKLKVGYNKVFGYFLEVSKGQLGKVPDYFIRKQTLVNAERFITPELKEFENKVVGAQDKRLELEYRLFCEIRNKVAACSSAILKSAYQVARLDYLVALAEAARKNRYVRPQVNEGEEIIITEGRHPVIERSLPPGRFVPNDIRLDQQSNEVIIITGPNMAGKSTVLRQTALIVLMAQMGGFVPADEALIGVVDRIFTRVGAMDDLRRGQSTFMVEMNETANILNNATERSLVILDEIGRGTSTFDGLAIAWSVAEELVDKNGRGVKTLFATHYHELTELAASRKRVQNYHIAVREWNDTIIFLHKLMPGGTNRSYGIQVAALAGVPSQVVERAHEILSNIEKGEFNRVGEPRIAATSGPSAPGHPSQLSLFASGEDPVRKRLQEITPDNLSPLDALALLYELKQL